MRSRYGCYGLDEAGRPYGRPRVSNNVNVDLEREQYESSTAKRDEVTS